MTPLLTLAALTTPSAADASAEPTDARWDWSRTHRFYLESEVQLPLFIWLATPFNHQARVSAFKVEIVTTCGQAEIETRNTVQVECRIDQIALSAAPLPSEQGLVLPIVEELDELLTLGTVQLQVNADGRVTNIDLEAIPRRNVRVGRITENLRLMLSRAYAGLDLRLPTSDGVADVQYQSWLFRAPTTASSGTAEIVNKVVGHQGMLQTVASAGRGTIYLDEGVNKYDSRMVSHATFDVGAGRIADREWTVVGYPTASSFIAQGAAGYAYVQRGRVVALGDAAWEVGPSREMAPSESQTAIQAAMRVGLQP